MKHDRRRICLSNNILYEWDKYTLQWTLQEEDGPFVKWFTSPEYLGVTFSKTYELNQETGVLSFPYLSPIAPNGAPDGYYYYPVREGEKITSLILDLPALYWGETPPRNRFAPLLTGYNGNVVSAGTAVEELDKVPYMYTKQQVKSEYVETVSDYNIGAYPDNGVQDGYWYVRRAK